MAVDAACTQGLGTKRRKDVRPPTSVEGGASGPVLGPSRDDPASLVSEPLAVHDVGLEGPRR